MDLGSPVKIEKEAVIDFSRFKEEFTEWLYKNIREYEVKQYIRDLDRTIARKKINNPHELAKIFEDRPKHYKVAIKNFMRFLEKRGYRTASQLMDFRAVITIPKSGIRPAEKAFTTTDKIIEALDNVNEKKRVMIKLLAYSGIRLTEAVGLIRTFDKSKLVIKNEVARYPLLKVGKTKKAFYAYMPADFARQLCKKEVTENMFDSKKLAKGIVLPNQLRKWNAMFLLEHGIRTDMIDFIQGRTPERILQKHYLNMVKLADEEYAKITDKFPF